MEKEITDVGANIAALLRSKPEGWSQGVAVLRINEEQLRVKEMQLRKIEEQLREELIAGPGPKLSPPPPAS